MSHKKYIIDQAERYQSKLTAFSAGNVIVSAEENGQKCRNGGTLPHSLVQLYFDVFLISSTDTLSPKYNLKDSVSLIQIFLP